MAAFIVCRPFWMLVIAFSFLLTSTCADDRALASITGNGRLSPGVIPKTVVSSKLRLVYYVGVEGTGHHYFANVFNNMFKKHSELQYVDSCNIGRSTYFPLLLQDLQSYNVSMEAMRQELRVLAGSEEHLPEFGTIVTVQRTHPWQIKNCGNFHQLSFPNKYGPGKVQAHPDLRVLTEMSEEEGVDLRFLYLQRSAWDLTVANTNHRKFHMFLRGRHIIDDRPVERTFLEYMHITLTNIAVLGSMLEELGSEFIICHKFSSLGDGSQAKAVAEFLAPSVEVARYLESAILESGEPRSGEGEELLFEAAPAIVRRLQRKLDSFEAKYCDFSS